MFEKILEPTNTGSIVPKAATSATYGGSGGAVYFGLTANEIGIYAGIAIALAGFFVNWYYKQKHWTLAQKNAAADDDE